MRLQSLDVLRGLTIFGMILVNSAAALHYGAEAAVFPTLLHAAWDGLTLADLVFPGFLVMVGVAIPLSLGDRRLGDGSGGRIGARVARLLLLGLLLSNLYWLRDVSTGDWRLFGVLQRIGLVYGACALLFLLCGPRTRLAVAAAILLFYWPVALLPTLDGMPVDIWVRGQNFAASVDRVLSAPHIYVQGADGYDPEGWLGTLPAIAQGLIGIWAGERLLAARTSGVTGHAARPLLAAGAAMLALGLAWGLVFPIVKDIWSSSFVLATSGVTLLLLTVLHLWLDRDPASGPRAPLFATVMAAFGGNAIAAYALHMMTAEMPGWSALRWPFDLLRGPLGDPLAALIPIALYLALVWACMEWLRRRGWSIRV